MLTSPTRQIQERPARSRDDFAGYLTASGQIDAMAAQRILRAAEHSGQDIATVILELGLLEEGSLADAMADFLGLQRIALAEFPAALPEGCAVPAEFLRQSSLLPVEMTDHELVLATARPLDDTQARAVAYATRRKLILRVGLASEITRHLGALLTGESSRSDFDGGDGEVRAIAESDTERLRDVASEAPVIRLLSRLVAEAVERGASDIHIEPLDDHVQVRLRVDGTLQLYERLDRRLQLGLISRIKILARLNIAEQRLPQDGRIRLAVKGRNIDLRVSTSPTLYGEGVVLRILDRKDVALDFAALGFDAATEAALKRLIAAPNGIILVTGPTGSGKTTTLYTALDLLNRPELKVFTVEDPIEIHLRGINQILVRPAIGLDFATVLRSLLRQDPDVIMVGEIRDGETAKIAVQASLTGHMVLSTLHTNSAASAITRLRDIGVDDFLIVSSLRAILAQRLVRKLCDTCKRPVADASKRVRKITPGFEPAGCPKCHNTGYVGRTVIYELLEITDEIKSAVLNRRPDGEIERLAQTQGMRTLFDCGMAKAAAGETSRQEVLRTVAAPEP